MVEIVPASVTHLNAVFQKNARLPAEQIDKAESFVKTITALQSEGRAPAAADVKQGQSILRNLQDQAELFLYNAAILAGQEAPSAAAIDKHLASVSQAAEKIGLTTDRLRETLKKLGA